MTTTPPMNTYILKQGKTEIGRVNLPIVLKHNDTFKMNGKAFRIDIVEVMKTQHVFHCTVISQSFSFTNEIRIK